MWKPINSPQDYPKPFEVVLISDGILTGVGYRNNRPDHPKGFRQDGWVVMYPPESDIRMPRIIKYQKLPEP